MPEENNVIGNINTISNDSAFGIISENSPFALAFQFQDYYDDKAVKKFINATERLIRTSREYATYIEELRTSVYELNHDSLMHNINGSDTSLEFHHYPFSLYEILETVMLQHISDKVGFTSFSLAKEVMELHYHHYIGLVSMATTTHELAHSGNIFISKSQIFGEYHKFMELYKDGITADLKNKIDTMESYSEQGIPSDFKGLLN